jgi:hypothetical protein
MIDHALIMIHTYNMSTVDSQCLNLISSEITTFIELICVFLPDSWLCSLLTPQKFWTELGIA